MAVDPQLSFDGIIFHRWRPGSSEAQVLRADPAATILNVFGFGEGRVHVLTDSILDVERLVVPEISFSIGEHAFPEFRSHIQERGS